MKKKKVNMYRIPMSKTEGAYAFVKATCKSEAQKKFDDDMLDNIEYDRDSISEQIFEQDGPIELFDTDVE